MDNWICRLEKDIVQKKTLSQYLKLDGTKPRNHITVQQQKELLIIHQELYMKNDRGNSDRNGKMEIMRQVRNTSLCCSETAFDFMTANQNTPEGFWPQDKHLLPIPVMRVN